VSTFDFGAGLLVLAAVVGVVNDRTLRLPRSVALLLASLAISASIIGTATIFGHTEMLEHSRVRIVHADLPQILLDGFLALLLFAGSLSVDARDLRRRAWPVFVLATLGMVLATGMFGPVFGPRCGSSAFRSRWVGAWRSARFWRRPTP
jgi:CPA1 family monovalent cation:H+ antiporter